MSDKFLNPIVMSFELLERYRATLSDSLAAAGLGMDEISTVADSMQVDRGLYLSLNRKYSTGTTSFRHFCAKLGLARELPSCLRWTNRERLYLHQEKAVQAILAGKTTIISTGTGSGKTEAFLIPIVNHCLQQSHHPGVKALIVYPMNALANDQVRRIKDAILNTSIRHGLFTGETSEEDRHEMRRNPPDILITNYVMLDWMLTRASDLPIFELSRDTLRYIVLDEIHTYRGNKATHLKYLLARLKAHFSGPIVQIGTSATLQTDKSNNSLRASSSRLDDFIKPLLGVTEFELIEPSYVPEPTVDVANVVLPMHQAPQSLGWTFEVDQMTGLRNLTQLTGRVYSLMDLIPIDDTLGFTSTQPYQDLQNNPFVIRLRQLLIERDACSFLDIVRELSAMSALTYPVTAPEELAKSFLSAIAFINFQSESDSQPLLDFRIHLFLKEVGGSLKRCIKCLRYHSGSQEICGECGYPLFYVYRADIRYCVGKVSNSRLRWELRPESDDRRNSYYVLISPLGSVEQKDDALTFREKMRVTEDEIVLEYDSYGCLVLRLLEERTYEQIHERLIQLAPRAQDHQYLYGLVASILDYEPEGHKKLLSFVDNRERASRYAVLMQDEFASRFFWEYLSYCSPLGREINIQDAFEMLLQHIPSEEELSPIEKDLFRELDLWFYREIGKPPTKTAGKDFLYVRNFDTFDEFDKELLEIFIAERALWFYCSDKRPHSRFIKLSKYLATEKRGIHLDEGEGSKSSISLGTKARKYNAFVTKYGTERIGKAIELLIQRGVIYKDSAPGGRVHFFLEPCWVNIRVPGTKYEYYHDLQLHHLRAVAVHSSEIPQAERQRVETDFQNNHLNLLVSTPTLEMGIDIGKLQNVLLLGVPPMPSNYAQRAGRAGRGRKTNYALIVTFCWEDEEHDMYYFRQPKLMIDGVISPPSFNPLNREILHRHINAYMLAGQVSNRRTLERYCANIDDEISKRFSVALRTFGAESGVEQYLLHEFKDNLAKEIMRPHRESFKTPQQVFFNSGFFPDYLFRHDQVYILEEGELSADTIDGDKEFSLAEYSELAVTEREPEIAYYKFAPDETIYAAGNVYRITAKGSYTEVRIDNSTLARSYQYLVGQRQVLYAAANAEHRKYQREVRFDHAQTYVDKCQVLAVATNTDCRLIFLNRGCRRADGQVAFTDENVPFNLGYELVRQALILRFDRRVCADEKIYLSLVAAVERAIISHYGLDESEIRVLVDVQPLNQSPENSTDQYVYVILYDAAGNGNVQLDAAHKDFDLLVKMAHTMMTDCINSCGQPCHSGCYQCLFSHSSRYLAGRIDKQAALMFTAYLLGFGRFNPVIAGPGNATLTPDLELRLARNGDSVTVNGPTRTHTAPIEGEQNKVIFELLTKAIQAEFVEGMQSTLIITKEEYLVDAINRGCVNKNVHEFARLQFNLLRFKSVRAEKEKT